MSSIVLIFTNVANVAIQLPIRGIQTSVNLQMNDGQPDKTATPGSVPTIRTTQKSLQITVTGDFNQFGYADVDYVNTWPGATSLSSVSSWSNLVSLAGAFQGCTQLLSVPNNIPLTVTDCRYMFCKSTSFTGLGIIEQWNTSNIQNMDSMFRDSAMDANISRWNLSSVQTMANMLNLCNLSSANMTAALIGWSQQPLLPYNIMLGALGIMYESPATQAINILLTQAGWQISGIIGPDEASLYTNIVVLEWYAPLNTYGTTILQYAIRAVQNDQIINYTTTGTETSFMLFNLEYNTQYLFYVAAITDNGLSDYSVVSNTIYLLQRDPYIIPKRYPSYPNISTPLRFSQYIKSDLFATPVPLTS